MSVFRAIDVKEVATAFGWYMETFDELYDIHHLKDFNPTHIALTKTENSIEIAYSQFCHQYMFNRKYAKQNDGPFACIRGIISARTAV